MKIWKNKFPYWQFKKPLENRMNMTVQTDHSMVAFDSVEEINYDQAAKDLKNNTLAQLFGEILQLQHTLESEIQEKKITLINRCCFHPYVKTSIKIIGVINTLSICGGMVYLAAETSTEAPFFIDLSAVALPLIYGGTHTLAYLWFYSKFDLIKKLEAKNEAAKSLLNLFMEFDKPRTSSDLSTLIRESSKKWAILENIFPFEDILFTLQPLLPEGDKITKYANLIKNNLNNPTIYQKAWGKLETEIKTSVNYVRVKDKLCLLPGNTLKSITKNGSSITFKPGAKVMLF
jgi:hypothetical protein